MKKMWIYFCLLVAGLSVAQAQSFVVDPASPLDLVTQVNGLADRCGFGCTIRIPAGEYTVKSGTILLHRNGISLLGDGRNNTLIHYAGLNFLDSRLPDGEYGKSFYGGASVGGFTIYCMNPQVRCMTSGSVIGGLWHDMTVVGPSGFEAGAAPVGSSEGFTFQNTQYWTERTIFRDIMMAGFHINFHFMAPRERGTDSFGYMLFSGIFTGQGPGSHGFVVDAGASVYNALGFSMQFNSGKTTTEDEVFSVGGILTGVGFHITGENAGAPITFAHVKCGARFNVEGDYNIFGGGVVADCPQTKSFPFVAFRFTPVAGLAGVHGSLGGVPVIAASDALGQMPAQPLSVYAYEPFQSENPYAVAYNGFVGNGAGRFSPISVYDPALPWCLATRGTYSQPNDVTYRMCVDGQGDVTATGALKGATVQTTRKTPGSSHEACTPGESWDDDNFHYHCTSSGQIKRLALQAF